MSDVIIKNGQVIITHDDKTPVYDGFTEKQLHDAFELVQSEKGWKMPIHSKCKESEMKVVSAAIGYFTGGQEEFNNPTIVKRKHGRFVKGDKVYTVTAPGYYVIIGA